MQLTLQHDKFYALYNYIIKIGYNSITNRNLQKRAKKARYETEKAFMETLQVLAVQWGSMQEMVEEKVTRVSLWLWTILPKPTL